MKVRYQTLHPVAGLILVMLALQGAALAQGLDPGTLLQPPGQSWPTYHGTYSGQHHSG